VVGTGWWKGGPLICFQPKRFKGKGTTKAVANVSGPISDAVKNMDVTKLFDLDEALKYDLCVLGRKGRHRD